MELHPPRDAAEAISEEFTSDGAERGTEGTFQTVDGQGLGYTPESVKLTPIDVDYAVGGDLALEELQLLAHYRALGTVPRLAVRRYLTAGDDRLVVAIYHQVFLGLRPR
jgi:hypothetical protein